MVSASVRRRDDGKIEIVTRLSIFGLAGQTNRFSCGKEWIALVTTGWRRILEWIVSG